VIVCSAEMEGGVQRCRGLLIQSSEATLHVAHCTLHIAYNNAMFSYVNDTNTVRMSEDRNNSCHGYALCMARSG
jgi:hypothetical protein